MQEEVEQKTMALSVRTARLTAELLQKAFRQFFEAQKKRVKSFLNQSLGTVTHKSERDYDRNKEKAKLRKEVVDGEE